MTDEKEPLEPFRAYYTRERAKGDEAEAIRLAAEETGLYSMLRRAFYAGWEARGKVPQAPEPVGPAVLEALEVLRSHFDSREAPEPAEKAVAAGLGGGRDALDHLVEAAQALPPLPEPTMRPPLHPAMMPPVTNLADYRTDGQPDGPNCPTCKSGDPDTRLPVWNEAFAEHTGCPDAWHPGNFTVMGAITGRMKRVAGGLLERKGE